MNFGIDRLIEDLIELGYGEVERVTDPSGAPYALIRNFEIKASRFVGRIIDLAIPAPPDYGRVVGAAIHVKSTPHLLDTSDTIPGQKNIQASNLGPDWRYWSHQFAYYPDETTKHLMIQINGVFKHA